MADLPSDEEKARAVLDIFKKHGARAGHGLLPQNFTAETGPGRFTMKEYGEGIKLGCDRGWFEVGPNQSVILTDNGFEAM